MMEELEINTMEQEIPTPDTEEGYLGISEDDLYEEEDDLDEDKRPYQILREFIETENIIDLVDENDVSLLGQQASQGFKEDKSSRAKWEEEVRDIHKIVAQANETKTYPWPGASNVKYPLILNSILQFNARAYPTLVNDGNPAKTKVIGQDPDNKKQDRADRVSELMSTQIMERMDGWEEGMDDLLIAVPTDGVAFKKVYFDNVTQMTKSEVIRALDLVVNDNVKDLPTAPRISQVFSLYPNEIQERVNLGEYDHNPKEETQEDGGVDKPEQFIEQHCWYDFDEDGYKEPYIVTFHEDSSEVVRIVANFTLESIEVDDEFDILKITPGRYFVKFACFPDPTGNFYGKGFGHLLLPINNSIDSILNQLIDAGHLSNTGGGFISNQFGLPSGSLKMTPGSWIKVNNRGGVMRDGIVPNPVPDPSPVLFSLLGMLVEAGKEISSVQDVMTGGGATNAPAATTLALIEQGMKVYSAIFKRIWRGLKEEFKLLYGLNREYMTDELYQIITDDPSASTDKDFELDSYDVIPAADPNMTTDIQRAGKASLLMDTISVPGANVPVILENFYKMNGIQDAEKYIMPPPQGPSPEQQLVEADIKGRMAELEIKMKEVELAERKLKLEEDNATAKRMKDIADANKTVAETDNIGGDNATNTLELLTLDEEVRNADTLDEATIRGVEGSAGAVQPIPNQAGGIQQAQPAGVGGPVLPNQR